MGSLYRQGGNLAHGEGDQQIEAQERQLVNPANRVWPKPARLWDRTAEFTGSWPLLDAQLHVGDGFLVGLAIGYAAGQLGDFDDERFLPRGFNSR